MDNDHGITGELRRYASYAATDRFRQSMLDIADRIDAEHERTMSAAALIAGVPMTDEDMAEHGWVKLPVSEDGDVLHIGELVDEKLPFGGYAAPAPIDTMELSRGASGYVWMVKLDARNRALVSAKLLRHHHEPTVEDVLREMLDAWGELPSNMTNEAIIAEYAKRLRLAGDE